jgi:hypothetical protein
MNNPARLLRKIDEDRCIEMATAMDKGVDFPAIVVFTHNNIVATGLHRTTAATKYASPARDAFDVYLIDEPDPYRRDMLMRSLNTLEGSAQTRQENLAHCAELHRLYPDVPIEEFAIAFNLKIAALREHFRLEKFMERCKELGIDAVVNPMSTVVKRNLAQIKMDPLLVSTVEILISTKETMPQSRQQLARDVANARSEEEAQKILKAYKIEAEEMAENAKRKHGRRRMDIPTRAMKPVKMIHRLPNNDDPTKLGFNALTPAQLKSDMKTLEEVIEILEAWKQEFKNIEAQREKKPWTVGEQPSASI